MCVSYSWSPSLFQTEIAQKLLDGLPSHFEVSDIHGALCAVC